MLDIRAKVFFLLLYYYWGGILLYMIPGEFWKLDRIDGDLRY